MVTGIEDGGPINLGLTIGLGTTGGSQLDVIGTEILFQAASPSPTPVDTSSAPAETTFVRITA